MFWGKWEWMIVSNLVAVALEMRIADLLFFFFLSLRFDYRCLCKPFLTLDINEVIYG